jgi:pimeloyl-ACP methyl ester carboxylesterase
MTLAALILASAAVLSPGTGEAANATPDGQAAMADALMDSLGIDRFALMCWSGGGPSSYRLAATRHDRVSTLVAVAAVSKPYTFEDPAEEKLLLGSFGKWLEKELVHHAPHFVVKMLVSQEGDLSRDQVKQLTEEVWEDPNKRRVALDLMGKVVGDRKAGFENDVRQFPRIDLGLPWVGTNTLLVHAIADSDVPYDHSENALAQLPNADLVRIEHGTHVSAWTDPDSEAIQACIADFLATP